MKLNRGLNRDVEHQNQPKNTYRDANNLVLSKDTDRLISELGSTKIIDLDQNEVVVGIINIPNGFVLFTQNGFTAPNTIYLYRDGVKSLILNTTLFNFNINYPISGEYKYNNKGELIIVFTSDNDIPRILNVDNLGFEVDSNKEFVNSSDLLKTRLFPKYIQPIINLNNINSSSGSLNSGIYYIGLQYKLIDNSYTNTSLLTNPIYIYKFNPKDNWYNITANKSKEVTSKSININILQLDNNYEYFRLLIIYKTEISINAYITNDYSIINDDITISSLNEYTEVDLADAITDNLSFERIHATTVFNNKLIVGNVEVKEPVKYQKYACNIKSEFVYEDEVTLNKYKNSYKDELVLFNKKGFMPFEIYAFYIRFIGEGEVSEAFHIPGRELPNIVHLPSVHSEDKEVYSSAEKWHMRDYSGAASGNETMGMWENANEFYPVDDEFDGSIDYDGKPILGGINLSDGNTKVRHHRFPSLQSLEHYSKSKYNTSFINNNPVTGLTEYIVFGNAVGSNSTKFRTTSSKGIAGHFESSSVFVNSSTYNLIGNLSYLVKLLPVEPCTLEFNIYVLKADNQIFSHPLHVTKELGILNVSDTIEVTLEPSQKLKIEFKAKNFIEDNLNFIPSTDTSINFVPDVIDNTITLNGKILGIKFTNIQIPSEIQERFTHFEILYAERTTGNISIVGNGIINKDSAVLQNHPNDRRFYSFDLLNNKPALNISYVRDELSIQSDTTETILSSDSTVSTDDVEDNDVNPVKTSKYIPNNIGYVEPSNENRDEYIHLEFTNEEHSIHGAPLFVDDTDWGKYARLVTAVNFKANVYTSFINQKLVRTGKLIPIRREVKIMTSDAIYGGDTILSLHGVTNINNTSDKNVRYYLIPEYSISNIGYRYADEEDITKIFYPKYNLISGVEGAGVTAYGVVNEVSNTIYDEIKKILRLDDPNFDTPSAIGEYYGYENVINSVLNIRASLIYNKVNSFNTKFPNRIHRSLPQSTESNNESWRIFKPLEYYDCINNKGKIVALDIDSHSILIEHEYTLTILTAKDNLQLNNSNIVALGSADVFDSRYIEIVPTDEGYIGCQSKWGSIRTKFGNIIVDRQRGKIFVYNNGKVTEITSHGLTRFMKANLNYDLSNVGTGRYDFDDYSGIQFDDNTYIDFTTETENTNQYSEIDNPFLGLGIIVAFDDAYDRLIVTRQNRFYLKDVGYIDRSFTMSYNFSIQAWISAMDLTPNSMINNRNGVFGITNYDDASHYKYKGVYKILDSLDKPCDFYDNGYNFQSYINVCFNTPINIDKHYLSFSWNTIVNDFGNEIFYNKTFNTAIVYAYNRHSDKIALKLQTYTNGNITNVDGVWRFNDFLNVLAKRSLDVIDNLDIHELQYDALPYDAVFINWYEKQPFINTFVVIKLVYYNSYNQKIEINDISSISKVINRI